MADAYEIDFLDVESDKSGDAIAIRYSIGGSEFVHVVDGGFQATGESVVNHIRTYYGDVDYIDHVVATHPDGDHAGGLRRVLEEFDVGALWLLRPWTYAAELLPRFELYQSVENLARRLKEVYPHIAALEEIALRKEIPILEPFQGSKIGAFVVLAPTRPRYLDLVVQSERTPAGDATAQSKSLAEVFSSALAKASTLVRAAWGEEVFSTEETSAENEMSVVQFARLCNHRILLTADSGRAGLTEAADWIENQGVPLPGIDKFQVPHHGSRRNVSTAILDRWLGPKLSQEAGDPSITAVVSSAKADADHPRKSVIRACIHRGALVVATEGRSICLSHNVTRNGWGPVKPIPYPSDQEE